jgi:GxxExxY protein
VVEVKAVEEISAVHVAQLLTYLKMTDLEVGLLVNFNAALLKHGLRRLIHKKTLI